MPNIDYDEDILVIDPADLWCGARCVWALAKAQGRDIDFQTVQQKAQPWLGPEGALPISGIVGLCQAFDISAEAIRCTEDHLYEASPAIIMLQFQESEIGHYVISLGLENDLVKIADPTMGDRFRYTPRDRFRQHWTGAAVLIGSHANDRSELSKLVRSIWAFLTGVILVGLLWIVRRRNTVSNAIIFGLLSLAFAGCNSIVSQGETGQTGVDFSVTSISLGQCFRDMQNKTFVDATFPFKNNTGHPVRVKDIIVSCTCLETNFPKDEIPPGGTGEVTLRLDLEGVYGKHGAHALVKFVSEEHDDLMQQLTCDAVVVDRMVCIPPAVDLGTVDLSDAGQSDVIVRVAESGSGTPTVRGSSRFDTRFIGNGRVKEFRGYVDYLLRVTFQPSDAVAGTTTEEILKVAIEIDGETHEVDLPVFARLAHPSLTASPAIVRLRHGSESGALFGQVSLKSHIEGAIDAEIDRERMNGDGVNVVSVESDTSAETNTLNLIFEINQRQLNNNVVIYFRDNLIPPICIAVLSPLGFASAH